MSAAMLRRRWPHPGPSNGALCWATTLGDRDFMCRLLQMRVDWQGSGLLQQPICGIQPPRAAPRRVLRLATARDVL